jgi:hypothetical protein
MNLDALPIYGLILGKPQNFVYSVVRHESLFRKPTTIECINENFRLRQNDLCSSDLSQLDDEGKASHSKLMIFMLYNHLKCPNISIMMERHF